MKMCIRDRSIIGCMVECWRNLHLFGIITLVLPILLHDQELCIRDSIYTVFEVKDENELLPEYLMR